MTNLSTPTNNSSDRFFKRLTLTTVVTVYLLIVAGGIVRSTGAGMGCPDWPKCFGSWIPPTEVSQLPLNYKEIYGAKLKGEVEFNAVKTWIEYVNRLLGAFTGILIFATLLASIKYLGSGRARLFYASLAAFILVGFQGWLGSKVVSTELHPVMITLHMLLAIVIVFILLYVLANSYARRLTVQRVKDTPKIKKMIVLVIALSMVQVIMGTQVRESVDIVIAQLGYAARSQWVDQLGLSFYVHRSFSILVLLANGLTLYWINKSYGSSSVLSQLAKYMLGVVGLEILTGVVMAYFSIPAFAQPLHLTLAILLLGVQYVMWLSVSSSEKPEQKTAAAVPVYN
jgi:heme a synthase